MPLYVYQKQLPEAPRSSVFSLPSLKFRFNFHPLPFLASIAGLVLIGTVVYPLLSYEIVSRNTPIPTTTQGLIIPSVDFDGNIDVLASGPVVVGNVDFTKASNWFATTPTNTPGEIISYNISIPKLKIENAVVIYGSDDLSKQLIQYPDTAMPGTLGSPVIFGHSILPQFYNPKNYMSIFSLLPTLNKGDTIIVAYDDIVYTYAVTDKHEVFPTDLSPLEQQYDSKKLKLITCVPPGLKLRRLVVTADLVSQ